MGKITSKGAKINVWWGEAQDTWRKWKAKKSEANKEKSSSHSLDLFNQCKKKLYLYM